MSYPNVITKTIKELKYISPAAVEDVVSALSKYGEEARIMAGGTDLLPLMKHRAVVPKYIISMSKIKGLDYIRVEDSELKIGALTKIAAIRRSNLIKENCLSLYEASLVFATPQIRNVATIGGNICRSSPSADLVPPLLAFDAQVKLVGLKGERLISLEGFFTGPGKNVMNQEVLTEIIIPLEGKQCGTAFQKLSRNSSDLAKINCAVKVDISNGRCNEVKIALGAVADRPVRARKTESVFEGKVIDNGIIEQATVTVAQDIAPITDVRSTADYRIEVSKVLVKRLIKLAIERAKGC